MGHFVYDDELDRIELDGEDWIDIKGRMSYGDQQRLVASYMKLQTQLKAEPDIDVNLEAGNTALLLINIKAWSLKGKDGKVAFINEGTVKQLDIDTATKIVEEINKRNPPPKA